MDMKQRIKRLGLTHLEIGRMLGIRKTSVTRQLNELSDQYPRQSMVSLVVAMEILHEQGLYEEYINKAKAELSARNLLD